jgi:hypothetical protein
LLSVDDINVCFFAVAYEIPKSALAAHPNCHPKRLINYAFNIRLAAADPDKVVESQSEADDDADEDSDNQTNQTGSISSPLPGPAFGGAGIKHQLSNSGEKMDRSHSGGAIPGGIASARSMSSGGQQHSDDNYDDEADTDDMDGEDEGDDVGDINFDNRDDDGETGEMKRQVKQGFISALMCVIQFKALCYSVGFGLDRFFVQVSFLAYLQGRVWSHCGVLVQASN